MKRMSIFRIRKVTTVGHDAVWIQSRILTGSLLDTLQSPPQTDRVKRI